MPWYTLRVPASSANIGPGFDALGVALGVYLTCRFRCSSALAISAEGRDAAGIPTSSDNLIWQTAVTVARSLHLRMPPIELRIYNEIPLGKGMGSSAAALTAGVVIADQLLNLHWKPLRILDEASRLEGHPDNVAPCTLGSIVASAIDSGGVTRAVRVDLPKTFGLAIVVPDFDLSTMKARSVLPSGYSREDAVFNVQRAALLIAALATGATSAFPAALEDRHHSLPFLLPLAFAGRPPSLPHSCMRRRNPSLPHLFMRSAALRRPIRLAASEARLLLRFTPV